MKNAHGFFRKKRFPRRKLRPPLRNASPPSGVKAILTRPKSSAAARRFSSGQNGEHLPERIGQRRFGAGCVRNLFRSSATTLRRKAQAHKGRPWRAAPGAPLRSRFRRRRPQTRGGGSPYPCPPHRGDLLFRHAPCAFPCRGYPGYRSAGSDPQESPRRDIRGAESQPVGIRQHAECLSWRARARIRRGRS